MNVSDIMSKKTIVSHVDETIDMLWSRIFQKKINALPVLDSQQKVVGIITKEDLLKYLFPDYSEFMDDVVNAENFTVVKDKIQRIIHLKAKDVMCTTVIFARHDTDVMRVLSRMIARRVNQLPVVDLHNTYLGMITKGDIFYALFTKNIKGKPSKKA